MPEQRTVQDKGAIRKDTAQIHLTVADQPAKPARKRSNARFSQKRADVIDAATRLLNTRGLAGLTLGDVAEQVGLGTSSITYYFRLKEQLAVAAFEESLQRIEAIVTTALEAPSPRERVASYLRAHVDLHYRIIRGAERPIAVLSEMRALDDKTSAPIIAHYRAIFRKLRAFFGPDANDDQIALNTARAQILSETVFWMPTWLCAYPYRDFHRVCERLLAIYGTGLAAPGSGWNSPIPICANDHDPGDARSEFLRIASLMISERGYRGASIARIAAQRNVSKGSFYHHHEAKDTLVIDCFRHSFGKIADAIDAAEASDGWTRLCIVVATLVQMQLEGSWPLMRTTALQTLPTELRDEVLARSARVGMSIAGLITEGMTDGSIRPVDAYLASMVIVPGINAAFEQRNRATRFHDRRRMLDLYASVLVFGLFDDRLL